MEWNLGVTSTRISYLRNIFNSHDLQCLCYPFERPEKSKALPITYSKLPSTLCNSSTEWHLLVICQIQNHVKTATLAYEFLITGFPQYSIPCLTPYSIKSCFKKKFKTQGFFTLACSNVHSQARLVATWYPSNAFPLCLWSRHVKVKLYYIINFTWIFGNWGFQSSTYASTQYLSL